MKAKYPWHQSIIDNVNMQQKEGLLSHALLFRCRLDYFDEALGWEIIKLILCDNKNGNDCCKHCHLINDRSDPNVIYLDVFNEKIGIDSIRQLADKVWQTSIFDKEKVIFINGFDFLSIAAQNSILKILEEPPKNVFFILSAQNISNVLVTIISRVQQLKHKEYNNLFNWLQSQSSNKKKIEIESEIIKIIKLANNKPKIALELLSSPELVKDITKEKQIFVDFLSGKISPYTLLVGFNKSNALEIISRFSTYTEGMIKFLFNKSLQSGNKETKNSLQCIKWNGLSLRHFYYLHDILTSHQNLCRTNVDIYMQLTTSLLGWQNDR